ncbi:hypothetical protein [Streptomyces sp. 6N223]|uniref:hypothetical protein n=1 Tax=Streptomyces sp. 6N223 TaxID=3457412 RepID=UPI003FCF8845
MGGLLLTLVDCDAAPRELGHAHHAQGLAWREVHAEPETPEAQHPAGPCTSYDVAALTERRPQPLPPLTAATVAVVVDPAAEATPSTIARPVERRVPRALAGRSRLSVVCRWRI